MSFYSGQASILMTWTLSPAHRRAPASHSVIVTASPPLELTHRGAESPGHADGLWQAHFLNDSASEQEDSNCCRQPGGGAWRGGAHRHTWSRVCSPRRIWRAPPPASRSPCRWPAWISRLNSATVRGDRPPASGGLSRSWSTAAAKAWSRV